jgi:hypothetical protein
MMTIGRKPHSNALRITIATLAAAMVRIAGYGVQGLAVRNPAFGILFYLIPLAGAGVALAALAGVDPLEWLHRPKQAEAVS